MKKIQVGFILLGVIFLSITKTSAQPVAFCQNEGSSADNSSNAPFEGSISFTQETISDTTFYTYHVKGNMVRMDIHQSCKNCGEDDNQLIFNLEKGTITALHPERKLYMYMNIKPFKDMADSNFEIKQTHNYKKIMGYNCYQWRVKNKSQNTEIAYWVVDDNFYFFDDLLRLWNRSEKHATYFLKIPNTDGFFPLLSVERTSLRDEKMRLQVVEINRTTLSPDLFTIPKDYNRYDR